jgi:hypothetical protein
MKSVISSLILWGVSIVQSQDAPTPIIDSWGIGLPVECLSHFLFLPFQAYYVITDYVVFLRLPNSRTPFRLRSTSFLHL